MKNRLALGMLFVLVPGIAVAAPTVRSIFDFDCANASVITGSPAAKLAAEAISAGPPEGVKSWGDRGVLIDSNGDGQPEVAVPLWCGATGNCTWAIYGGKPIKLLGRVDAEVIRVPAASGSDGRILTYSHLSAMDGTMSSYVLRSGQYVKVSEAAVAASEAIGRMGCDGGKVPCCK